MAKLKILAGAYADNEYMYIRNKDQMSNLKRVREKNKFYISNIASIEIANQDNCKKAGGTIASAVIGGVLFGGVGAIVGAMAGGNEQITTVILTYENGTKSLAQVDSDMFEILQTMLFDKKSFMLKHKRTKSRFWKYVLIFFAVMVIILMLSEKGETQNKGVKIQNQENIK
ncbi:hypothetical protein C3I19_08920 [Campylobacter jejuni]|uniref:hypothetical protein n=1 Tax=Campylobacter jejuni TaxID=197 RepID=UPI000F809ED9|nr:hypothetical protein [Campylobacter jejuni]RTI66742.1 hypothetical protein C3I19_08920 [Campylobacter jejuni]